MLSQPYGAPTPTELEVRTVAHTIKRRKANWLGYILRRNYLLEQFIMRTIKGRIEVKGRRGRSKRLLNDIKEMRGYWKQIEEALDRTVLRNRSGRGCGPGVRQTTQWKHFMHSHAPMQDRRKMRKPLDSWSLGQDWNLTFGPNKEDCYPVGHTVR